MQIGQVVHFLAVLQMVNHQHVGLPTLVELLDHIAADEAGAAGDDDHRMRRFVNRLKGAKLNNAQPKKGKWMCWSMTRCKQTQTV